MTMAMIYGIVFLIEALIAFQYFEWMFVKPRYTVIKRFVLVLACYVVLFTSLDKGTQRKTTENELPSLTQCTA